MVFVYLQERCEKGKKLLANSICKSFLSSVSVMNGKFWVIYMVLKQNLFRSKTPNIITWCTHEVQDDTGAGWLFQNEKLQVAKLLYVY